MLLTTCVKTLFDCHPTTIGSSDSSRMVELNISGSSWMRAREYARPKRILITLPRLGHRMFENPLSTLAKFIFVSARSTMTFLNQQKKQLAPERLLPGNDYRCITEGTMLFQILRSKSGAWM